MVVAEDREADDAERQLLESLGLSGVLAAGAPSHDGAWLVEIYADGGTVDLHGAAPYIRMLAAEAVRGAAVDSLVLLPPQA